MYFVIDHGTREWVEYIDNNRNGRSRCGGSNSGYGVNMECHYCGTDSRGWPCDRVNAFALTYIYSSKERTRIHAANLLKTTIVYLEEHITVNLHKVVGTLCRCAKGLSEEWSKEVTGLVARFVPTDSLIKLVL